MDRFHRSSPGRLFKAPLRRLGSSLPGEQAASFETVYNLLIQHPVLATQIVNKALPGPSATENSSVFLTNYEEALELILWLICGGNFPDSLVTAGILSGDGSQGGVCGSVWGPKDIAYRCKTCEHDPTCAICVSCFQNGNHDGHDYSIMPTVGGCCDCGDPTAWKRSGFCSRHKGPGVSPPLSASFSLHARSILVALMREWVVRSGAKGRNEISKEGASYAMTRAVCTVLLKLCNASEGLAKLVADVMTDSSIGVLPMLMRSQSKLPSQGVHATHSVLYKLLGIPQFKYSFALEFLAHYPVFLNELKGHEDESHPMLDSFSVQIFTVPGLTSRLVIQNRLLDILIGSLKHLLLSAAGADGQIDVHKIEGKPTRITGDLRYSLSHKESARFLAWQRQDLVLAWFEILAYIQGMCGQKRMTGAHVEHESEDWWRAYFQESQLAYLHPLLVSGASCVEGPGDAWLGEHERMDMVHDVDSHTAIQNAVSRESGDNVESTRSTERRDQVIMAPSDMLQGGRGEDLTMDFPYGGKREEGNVCLRIASVDVPKALMYQIHTLSRVLVVWLESDLQETPKPPPNKFWLVDGKGRQAVKEIIPSTEEDNAVSMGMNRTLTGMEKETVTTTVQTGLESDNKMDRVRNEEGSMEDSMVSGSGAAGAMWNSVKRWSLVKEAAVQEVSFHIPLHRLLALLLHRALVFFGIPSHIDKPLEAEDRTEASDGPFVVQKFKTDEKILSHLELGDGTIHETKYRKDVGRKSLHLEELLPTTFRETWFFEAVMEHPLRLAVTCSQIHAGMWRRNGSSMAAYSDLYRSVHWCEDGLELDIFLLQLCAAVIPPDVFVARVRSRFNLDRYFSLNVSPPAEYEASLAKDFLGFLIRIVTERTMCGLTPEEVLRRELIQRLAVGDATHNSLLKSLPSRLTDHPLLSSVLDSVAMYSAPLGLQQGKYSLRAECWQELDLYHPRWSLRELQRGEERYFHATKASALANQVPRWQSPFDSFNNLQRIVKCQQVHDLLLAVFHNAGYGLAGQCHVSDDILFASLHLLSLSLEVTGKEQKEFDTRRQNSRSGNGSAEGQAFLLPPLVTLAKQTASRGPVKDCVGQAHSFLSLLVRLLRSWAEKSASLSQYVAMGASRDQDNSFTASAEQEDEKFALGKLLVRLLQKFSSLDSECKEELTKLAPEIMGGQRGPSQAVGLDKTLPETDVERRRALAKAKQAEALAKMRAQQEKFKAAFESMEEEDVSDSEEEGVSMKDTVQASIVDSQAVQVHPSAAIEGQETKQEALCAYCKESGSTKSPLCHIVLAQRSRLLALSDSPVRSWERGGHGRSVHGGGGGGSVRKREVGAKPKLPPRHAAQLLSWLDPIYRSEGGKSQRTAESDVTTGREEISRFLRCIVEGAREEDEGESGEEAIFDKDIHTAALMDVHMVGAGSSGGAMKDERERRRGRAESVGRAVLTNDVGRGQFVLNEGEVGGLYNVGSEGVEVSGARVDRYSEQGTPFVGSARGDNEEVLESDTSTFEEPVGSHDLQAEARGGVEPERERESEGGEMGNPNARESQGHTRLDGNTADVGVSERVRRDTKEEDGLLGLVLGQYFEIVQTERTRGLEYSDSLYILQGNLRGRSILRDVPSPSESTSETSKQGSRDPTVGVHVLGCGHKIHLGCFYPYMFSLHGEADGEESYLLNLEMGEYLCPICRRLANCVLPPASPDLAKQLNANADIQTMGGPGVTSEASTWEPGPSNTFHFKSKPSVRSALDAQEQCEDETVIGSKAELQYLEGGLSVLLSSSQKAAHTGSMPLPDPEMVQEKQRDLFTFASQLHRQARLSQGRRQGRSPQPNFSRRKVEGLSMWETLWYTIASTEIAARGALPEGSKSLNSTVVLSGNFLAASGYFLSTPNSRVTCLSLALNEEKGSLLRDLAGQCLSLRSHCLPLRLMRASWLLLFLQSLLEGRSGDEAALASKGGKSEAVPNTETDEASRSSEEEADDRLVWQRAANPVLVTDAFASLARVLFCLPDEVHLESSFHGLVHLMYSVCVTQAIARSGRTLLLAANVPPRVRFLIGFIGATTRDLPFRQPADDENSLGLGPLDWSQYLRLHTLPYLRRCALLQHLLFGNTEALTPKSPVLSTFGSAGFWFPPPANASLDLHLQKQTHGESRIAGSKRTFDEGTSSRSAVACEIVGGRESDRFMSSSPSTSSLPNQGDLINTRTKELIEIQMQEVEVWEKEFHIPPLTDLLEDEGVWKLVTRWCRHAFEEVHNRGIKEMSTPTMASPFSLISLPHQFHDLFQRYVHEKCVGCGAVPDQPALCLFCSTLCCGMHGSRLNPACGEVSAHTHTCGGGTGVYLLLRRTSVLLLRLGRCSMWPSPYLDVYGEEDENFKRGKPLYLSKERYTALTSLVACHGIDHNTTVLSQSRRWLLF